MNFLSFEQWQEREIDFISQENPQIDCPVCDGVGIISDEDGSDACMECDCFGLVEFNDLSEYGQCEYFNKSRYFNAIQIEFSLLASFTGKNESELYFDNGFIAWCLITTKNILIRQ